MPKTRQVAGLDEKGRGYVLTEAVPEVTTGCVLVKVHASLISPGTEMNAVKMARAGQDVKGLLPRPFGYQNAGVVVQAGEGVAEFRPGDRVACMGGAALHTNWAVVPKNLCARLPDNVSFEQGAFSHLAMTSLHAVRRGRPELGEYLLVVGLGLVGQMAARLGQIAGQYAMGWDMIPFRCDAARRFGMDETTLIGREDETARAQAFTRGLGFDMAVVAIGGEASKALQSVKNVMKVTNDTHAMGRICLVGGAVTTCQWGAGMGNLDLLACSRTGAGYHDKAWERGEVEYPPVFVRWHTRANMEYVLRLMSEGKLPVERLVTHRLPLARVAEGVDALVERPETALGVVLLMEHE